MLELDFLIYVSLYPTYYPIFFQISIVISVLLYVGKEEFIATMDKSFIDSEFDNRIKGMIGPAKQALGIN